MQQTHSSAPAYAAPAAITTHNRHNRHNSDQLLIHVSDACPVSMRRASNHTTFSVIGARVRDILAGWLARDRGSWRRISRGEAPMAILDVDHVQVTVGRTTRRCDLPRGSVVIQRGRNIEILFGPASGAA